MAIINFIWKNLVYPKELFCFTMVNEKNKKNGISDLYLNRWVIGNNCHYVSNNEYFGQGSGQH